MMKNRSPCTKTTTALLLLEAAGAAPQAFADRDERLLEPPPTVRTPERVAESGVQPKQVSDQVALHETVTLAAKPVLTEATVDGRAVTQVKADVAYCDIINRNGRYYPRSCYEAANAAAQADMADGGLWGLMDHPDWWEPMKGSLGRIAVRYDSLAIEDRQMEYPPGSGVQKTMGVVVATGVIVETAVGIDAKGLLQGGIRVGISTNGFGSVQWVQASELDPNFYDPEALIPVTQDDFRYLSIDLVSDPSNVAGRATTEAHRPPVHAHVRPAAQTPPPTVTPPSHTPKEGTMHEYLKTLMAKFPGKTLEQIKTEQSAEYLAVCEKIALESVPAVAAVPAAVVPPAVVGTPANPPAQESAGATRNTSLETAFLTQQGQITTLERTLLHNNRERMAERALLAANLPQIPLVGEGESAIDLSRSFANDVMEGARNAETDEAAQAFISRKILEQSALTAHLRKQPAAATPGPFDYLNREGAGGVTVPAGQTSSSDQQGTQDAGYDPLRLAAAEWGF